MARAIWARWPSVILTYDLRNEIDLKRPGIPVSFMEATPNNAACHSFSPLYPSTSADRLSRGDRCVIGLANDAPVCHVWFTFDSVILPLTKGRINLGSRECWLYDAWTHEQYRGHGLYAAGTTFMFQRLKNDGYEVVRANVDEPNQASIRGLEKAGMTRERRVVACRLFGILHYVSESRYQQ